MAQLNDPSKRCDIRNCPGKAAYEFNGVYYCSVHVPDQDVRRRQREREIEALMEATEGVKPLSARQVAFIEGAALLLAQADLPEEAERVRSIVADNNAKVAALPMTTLLIDMDLPTRVYSPLRRNNIRTLSDLLSVDPKEIVKFVGIGRATYAELRLALSNYGVHLPK